MDTWSGHGEGVGPQYIPRLCVTEEYIPLYLSVRRSQGIYSSALYSSVGSSVNRGI
jgi:hypothetical protein